MSNKFKDLMKLRTALKNSDGENKCKSLSEDGFKKDDNEIYKLFNMGTGVKYN